jgi:CelD/BcsL family acetyltransferase involved in cellulose biosynthesis
VAGTIEAHWGGDDIAREWEELARRSGAPPFLWPGWLELFSRAFGSGAPLVLAVRRGGRLAGVLPLVARGGVVESPTNWHTPEFGAVAEDDDAVRELIAGVFARRPRRASLWFLNNSRAEVEACRAAARAAGYRPAVHELERPPYVALDGDWGAFEASLPAKMRSDLRRRWRLLEKEGTPTVEVLDGRENLAALLDEGFRVEASGWKDKAGTAIISRPDTRRFYTEAAGWLAERGWLRLSFLRLDGEPLAFEYAIEHAGVYYFLKGGYDAAYGRFAPSKLLIRAVLERAFANGLKRFDFGGRRESFKLEWANGHRELVHFQGFAPSPLGMLDHAAAPVRRYGPYVLMRLKALHTR